MSVYYEMITNWKLEFYHFKRLSHLTNIDATVIICYADIYYTISQYSILKLSIQKQRQKWLN